MTIEQGTLDSLAEAIRLLKQAYIKYEHGELDEFEQLCDEAKDEINAALVISSN